MTSFIKNNGEKGYNIYPTPHHIEYDNGELSLKKDVHVIYDDTIDDVTKEKLTTIFEDNHLPTPKTADEPSDSHINIFIGTHGSDGPAERNAKKVLSNHDMDFNKLDAYQLEITNDTIIVIGKDTDATFHGLSSLKAILDQSQDGTIKNLKIKDYASTEFRGFIEGFYGIPWSNEDRKSLMTFGGQFKANTYIFAPKDDPYHREKWDKLYPEEKLEGIRDVVEAGQKNKVNFVWSISPLGEVAKIAQEEGEEAAMELLDENKEKVLNKFEQLYDVGVRQFGVLGDDVGALPLDYVVKLMNAISDWADEKGDIKDTIYTPAAYNSSWAWDGGKELNKLEKNFSDNVQILWTGSTTVAPVEQETIDDFKQLDNNGLERRDPLFWLNWPVNDVDMTRVFLGKASILNPGVENLAGVVTNPMQEAEASKVAIFAIADYTWNTADFNAQKSWEDSMKYVDPNAPKAFHTLAKHMAYADPEDGWPADESEDIKDLLNEVTSRLNNDKVLGDTAPELIDELQGIADAGDDFLTKTENEELKEELKPFVNALHDMVLADIAYLKAQQDIDSGNLENAQDHYASGQTLRERSLNYDRPVLEEEEDVKARPAAKRLQPFTDHLEENVMKNIEEYKEQAYFSDSITSHNSFTAGTLDLSMKPTELVNLKHLKPGDTITRDFELQNNGTLTINKVLLETDYNVVDEKGDNTQDFGAHIQVKFLYNADKMDEVIYETTLAQLKDMDPEVVSDEVFADFLGDGGLKPGEKDDFVVKFKFIDNNEDQNQFQGDELNLEWTFNAQQDDGEEK